MNKKDFHHCEQKALSDGIIFSKHTDPKILAIWQEDKERKELMQFSPRKRWPQLSRAYERITSDPNRLHETHYGVAEFGCEICMNI